jgi:hypothetical protein
VKKRPLLVTLAIFLAACDKRPAEAPVDAAPSAAPVVPQSVPSLTPTSGRRACGADMADAAKPPDATLARALVDLTADAPVLRAPVFKRDDGAHVVVDCMGHSSRTDWSGKDPSRESGVLQIAARQELPGGRLAVWLATGMPAGLCSGENGFFAIMHPERGRLAVDGASEWTSSCGNDKKLRVEKLGDETVYVEGDTTETQNGKRAWQTIWRLRPPSLSAALKIDVGRAPAQECSAPTMSAKVTFEGKDVKVEESWQTPKECPGGGGAARKVARRYRLGDSSIALVDGPPPPQD